MDQDVYSRAREGLTSSNIISGWRAAGLKPLSPITVLEKLVTTPALRPLPFCTPGEKPGLDISLLRSSPPEGTELRQANALFKSQISRSRDVPFPAKRYAERMTRALETIQSELVTIRNELAEQGKLLRTRKGQRNGKPVKLKGRFVFSTPEVLDIAREAEAETSVKKGRKRARKRTVSLEIEDDVEDITENVSSDAESDCIFVANRKLL